MSTRRPAILSIAGFDPTAGAGILTDAAVFRALGFHPLAVLTSVAAQGASGVAQIRSLPEEFIQRQLDVVAAEFNPAGVKIGMLYGLPAVKVVTAFLSSRKILAVLDPLIWASSGKGLIRPSALSLLARRLMPLCRVITPNLVEAEYFLQRPVGDVESCEHAARELARRWKTAVLLKGGHLPGDPVDVLVEGDRVYRFLHPRIAPGIKFRGTGCALSSALAVGIAKGKKLTEAVEFAGDFVREVLTKHYLAAADETIGFMDYK